MHGAARPRRYAAAVPGAVVVVDELALVRHGVRRALEAAFFEVVGETHSLRDALTMASAPGVAVVVVGATGSPPAEAARRVKALPSSPLTVVLLAPGEHDVVAELLAAGADAIVSRGIRPDELADTVARSLDGERIVAPALRRTLVGTVAIRGAGEGDPGTARDDEGGDGSPARLSAREHDVLALLAAGRSNREIAEELSLSLATVKSHLVHLYAKLGARDRADAVRVAVVRGLLA